jgi:hypothetical protein
MKIISVINESIDGDLDGIDDMYSWVIKTDDPGALQKLDNFEAVFIKTMLILK